MRVPQLLRCNRLTGHFFNRLPSDTCWLCRIGFPPKRRLINVCEDCGGPGVSWEDGVILCDGCAILRAKKSQIDRERNDG